MQPSQPADRFVPGAQIEVIGIAQDNRRIQIARQNTLDRRLGSDGHKDGSLDSLVRQQKLSPPPARLGLRNQIER